MGTSTVPEKAYEKNAWILLAIIGIVGILFGLAELAGVQTDNAAFQSQLGQSVSSFQASNPKAWSALTQSYQYEGAALLGFGIFGLAISYTAYRRGEKWAWFASLYVPLYFVYITAADYSLGGSIWPLTLVLLVVDLVGLFLPYRKFFPRKQM